MQDNYAVLIPTHSDHSYLKRSIEFFSAFDINVYYFDSKKQKYNGKFPANIKYFHVPEETSAISKILNGLRHVKEDYVALCAVDDFVLPLALKNSYEFLSKNNSYSVAIGHFFCFEKEFDGKFGHSYRYVYKYWLKNNIPYDSTQERVKHYLNNYYQLFWGAMHEKKRLINIFNTFTQWQLSGYIFFEEIFLGAMTLAQGNIKFMPELCGVRESTPITEKHKRGYVYPCNQTEAKYAGHELYQPEYERVKSIVDKEYYDGFTDLILESYEVFYNENKTNKQEKFKKYDTTTHKSVNSLREIKSLRLLSDEDFLELEKIHKLLYRGVPIKTKTRRFYEKFSKILKYAFKGMIIR